MKIIDGLMLVMAMIVGIASLFMYIAGNIDMAIFNMVIAVFILQVYKVDK